MKKNQQAGKTTQITKNKKSKKQKTVTLRANVKARRKAKTIMFFQQQ